LFTDHFVRAFKTTTVREESMATSHAAGPATASAAKSDQQSNAAAGGLACLLVVAAAMGSLWLGLSGLLQPEHAGGMARTLGGIVGFSLIFALTLVAAVRQK